MKIEVGDIFYHPQYGVDILTVIAIYPNDRYLVSIDHYRDDITIVHYRLVDGKFLSTLFKKEDE